MLRFTYLSCSIFQISGAHLNKILLSISKLNVLFTSPWFSNLTKLKIVIRLVNLTLSSTSTGLLGAKHQHQVVSDTCPGLCMGCSIFLNFLPTLFT